MTSFFIVFSIVLGLSHFGCQEYSGEILLHLMKNYSKQNPMSELQMLIEDLGLKE